MIDDPYAKIVTERRYEAVVRQILALIGGGEIPPGTQLPAERDLAERLGVSRNVLREAFRVLEARGIVRSRQGGGRYVRAENLSPALSPDGVVLQLEQAVIADILEARELLETRVVRLAAVRATAEQALALAAMDGGGWEDNVRFHTAVAAATGNFMLERLVRLQLDLLRDVRQRDHYSAGTAADLLAEHRAIAEAIAAGDPDAAEAAVRRHLSHTHTEVARP
ncbi:MAG: FadR family transcriptional regulator [Nonomuraea sp.]|nr:FadR family transcriptional regulator [Nonomuraea sp.]